MFNYDTDVEKKIRVILDTCDKITDADRCELAYKRYKCFKQGSDEIIASRPKPKDKLTIKMESTA